MLNKILRIIKVKVFVKEIRFTTSDGKAHSIDVNMDFEHPDSLRWFSENMLNVYAASHHYGMPSTLNFQYQYKCGRFTRVLLRLMKSPWLSIISPTV